MRLQIWEVVQLERRQWGQWLLQWTLLLGLEGINSSETPRGEMILHFPRPEVHMPTTARQISSHTKSYSNLLTLNSSRNHWLTDFLRNKGKIPTMKRAKTELIKSRKKLSNMNGRHRNFNMLPRLLVSDASRNGAGEGLQEISGRNIPVHRMNTPKKTNGQTKPPT